MAEEHPGKLKQLDWWLDQGYEIEDLVQAFAEYDWYIHKWQVQNYIDFLNSLDKYGTTGD